jgi:hypothetical protein
MWAMDIKKLVKGSLREIMVLPPKDNILSKTFKVAIPAKAQELLSCFIRHVLTGVCISNCKSDWLHRERIVTEFQLLVLYI